jgi:hypothetical protein
MTISQSSLFSLFSCDSDKFTIPQLLFAKTAAIFPTILFSTFVKISLVLTFIVFQPANSI